MEQNLSPFRNWFDKLRFADAILKPEDLGNKVWHVRHVLLSPNCVKNVSFGTAPRVFYTCARQFYNGIFHSSPSMKEQIERAMEQDITLMILAFRASKHDAVPKSFSPFPKSLITVSAVSFQMFRDPNDAKNMSVFLSLLGVTHHSTPHPPSL